MDFTVFLIELDHVTNWTVLMLKKISLDLTRIKPIQYSTVGKSGDFLFIQTFNLKLLKLNKQNNCKTQKLSFYKNLKFRYWLKFHIYPHTNYPQKAEIEDQGNRALLFHTSPVSFLFYFFQTILTFRYSRDHKESECKLSTQRFLGLFL